MGRPRSGARGEEMRAGLELLLPWPDDRHSCLEVIARTSVWRRAAAESWAPKDEGRRMKDEEPVSAGLGVTTGALLIVANMIGVGVFTTTGFMVDALKSPPAVLVAWLLGGVAAFS